MTEYREMAERFMSKTGTTMSIQWHDTKKNPWNTDGIGKNWFHHIYKVIIKRNGKQFTVYFTDNARNYENGEKPTCYDVLACLTKYDPGTFHDFCNEFGYEEYADYYEDAMRGTGYNRKSYNTYKAVIKEWENVEKLFGDVLEELAEIA